MTVSSEVELATARLDVCPQRLAALVQQLSLEERGRAARFRFERDRSRFIAARVRLREELAARLGTSPASVELVYGSHGKPALAGRLAESGWRFNVSHCEDLALYAFSRESEVGIDVEALRPFPEADEIAARFFSPPEHRGYLALAPHERPLEFFTCWTRREALAKGLGLGLAEASSEFKKPSGWRLRTFSPLPGFVAALASRH